MCNDNHFHLQFLRTSSGGRTYQHQHAINRSTTSSYYVLVSLEVLAEKLHRPPTHRRLQPLNFAPFVCLVAVLVEDTHQITTRRRFLPIAFTFGSAPGKSWRRNYIEKWWAHNCNPPFFG